MASGIRATVTFSDPEICPITQLASEADAIVDHVVTSVAADSPSVSELLVDDDGTLPDREPLFSYGDVQVYRIAHDGTHGCPCECLGEFGCPIHRYTAEAGKLTLVFHAESFTQLQDIMATLRERFPTVDVRRLLQPPLEGTPDDRVFVNLGRLTDRQREVLHLAHARGYFERPRRANATDLASELDISPSTFTEHLVAAQRKLLDDALGPRE